MFHSPRSSVSPVRKGTSSTLRRQKKERNHADTGKFGNLVTACDLIDLIFFVKGKVRSYTKIEGMA